MHFEFHLNKTPSVQFIVHKIIIQFDLSIIFSGISYIQILKTDQAVNVIEN